MNFLTGFFKKCLLELLCELFGAKKNRLDRAENNLYNSRNLSRSVNLLVPKRTN